MLPASFRYPAAFLALAQTPSAACLEPWAFIDAASELGRLAYLVRCHGGKNLVPFASVFDDRKDVACFDGNDVSGDPRVGMLRAFGGRSPYLFATFAAWHAAATADAARWRER